VVGIFLSRSPHKANNLTVIAGYKPLLKSHMRNAGSPIKNKKWPGRKLPGQLGEGMLPSN
jgi:hypothetical protein